MKKVLGIGLMVGALALVAAPKAEAAVGSFHVCHVGWAGPGPACVDFAGNSVPALTVVGNYIVEATGSFLETSSIAQTANTNIQIRRNAAVQQAGALEVWYTVQGYVMPGGPAYVMDTTAGATKTGVATDTISYSAWYSSDNTVGFPVGVLGGTGTCNPPIGASAGSTDGCLGNANAIPVGPGSNLYALITRTTFALATTDGSIFGSSSQSAISAVPEPGTMMLFGTGLVGMATVLRRRFAKK